MGAWTEAVSNPEELLLRLTIHLCVTDVEVWDLRSGEERDSQVDFSIGLTPALELRMLTCEPESIEVTHAALSYEKRSRHSCVVDMATIAKHGSEVSFHAKTGTYSSGGIGSPFESKGPGLSITTVAWFTSLRCFLPSTRTLTPSFLPFLPYPLSLASILSSPPPVLPSPLVPSPLVPSPLVPSPLLLIHSPRELPSVSCCGCRTT